jgi:predicted NBD/HSP70 family sugar kinase
VSSGEAIAREAREALLSPRAGVASLRAAITKDSAGDVSKLEAKMVFDAAAAGNSLAQSIVAKAAAYIGIGISLAVNILDCDRVLVSGGLTRNGPRFLEQIQDAMDEHVVARAGRHLLLSAGAGDEYSTAKGASRILLNTLWTGRKLPI